jgi:hypothetical protein
LIFLQIACISISNAVQDGPEIEERNDAPDLYRRYLWVMLDGLTPQRDDTAPLPVQALTTAQLHVLLSDPLTDDNSHATRRNVSGRP